MTEVNNFCITALCSHMMQLIRGVRKIDNTGIIYSDARHENCKLITLGVLIIRWIALVDIFEKTT